MKAKLLNRALESYIAELGRKSRNPAYKKDMADIRKEYDAAKELLSKLIGTV